MTCSEKSTSSTCLSRLRPTSLSVGTKDLLHSEITPVIPLLDPVDLLPRSLDFHVRFPQYVAREAKLKSARNGKGFSNRFFFPGFSIVTSLACIVDNENWAVTNLESAPFFFKL